MRIWWNRHKCREQGEMLSQQSPVVLMGRGHSGTRILSWACSKLGLQLGFSDDRATGDADDQKFTEEIKALAINNVGITRLGQIREGDLYRFQRAVAGYYTCLGSPQGLWGWKFPETYLITPYITKTFPHARYVHMVRDGRDIAFKYHLTDDPKRKLGKRILSVQNALMLPHHLQAAISWAFQVDNFDAFRPFIPPEQVFDLTFETLCLQPNTVMQQLCDFLHIQFTQTCATYLKEQVELSKVNQYKENEPALVREVETRVRRTLQRYSYLDSP